MQSYRAQNKENQKVRNTNDKINKLKFKKQKKNDEK